MTDEQSNSQRFTPTAWTPARVQLWNALEGDDRKTFEEWVMAGNKAEIPSKFQSRYDEIKDIEQKSKVPAWLMKAMLGQGWLRNNIETTWGRFYNK